MPFVDWEHKDQAKAAARADHDHLLVFAKSSAWLESGWNLIPRSAEQLRRFRNPDNDPEGPWRTYPLGASDFDVPAVVGTPLSCF